MTADRSGRRRRTERAPRLFDRGELRLHPTGEARFRTLTRRPARHPTTREARSEEDLTAMAQLRARAKVLAPRFDMRYRRIEPEQDGVYEHYGICYDDGVIRIRLRHAVSDRLLKESSLADTLCHELAHLRHMDHSVRFRNLYREILDEARRLGYYRPGKADDDGPRQGHLFEGCGVEATDG